MKTFDASALPAATRATVLRCVLDALGSAAAALDQPGVAASQQAGRHLYGAGPSPIWFTGRTAAAAAALLANSTATAALDLDDGYRRARGHPGAAVIPAALACIGTYPEFTTEEFMAAVVVGYETGIRLAMGRRGYAPSGAWAPYAVVATVGRLTRAGADVIAQALAICAQTAPALPALAGIAGSDVKEGIPAGCAAGWAALQLAQAGSTGPIDIFEDATLFDRDAMLDGLDGAPLIDGTYFKPFGCCRHIHGALDAYLALQREHRCVAADIASIEVHTYRATFNLSNKPAPATLVEAQYSVPFCLALCVLHGPDALLPLRRDALADPQVRAMADRVEVLHDPAIEPLFPQRSPSWVSVVLHDGRRLRSALTDPRGDPSQPLGWDDLAAKLRTASRHTLRAPDQNAVIEGVAALGQGDWAPLMAAIRSPGIENPCASPIHVAYAAPSSPFEKIP